MGILRLLGGLALAATWQSAGTMGGSGLCLMCSVHACWRPASSLSAFYDSGAAGAAGRIAGQELPCRAQLGRMHGPHEWVSSLRHARPCGCRSGGTCSSWCGRALRQALARCVGRGASAPAVCGVQRCSGAQHLSRTPHELAPFGGMAVCAHPVSGEEGGGRRLEAARRPWLQHMARRAACCAVLRCASMQGALAAAISRHSSFTLGQLKELGQRLSGTAKRPGLHPAVSRGRCGERLPGGRAAGRRAQQAVSGGPAACACCRCRSLVCQ